MFLLFKKTIFHATLILFFTLCITPLKIQANNIVDESGRIIITHTGEVLGEQTVSASFQATSSAQIEDESSSTNSAKLKNNSHPQIDVYEGANNLSFSKEGIALKDSQGKTITLKPTDNIFTIDEHKEQKQTKIGEINDKFFILKKNILALTNFALSIDLTTNVIKITEGETSRILGIFPDQAVNQLLSLDILDTITVPNLGNLESLKEASDSIIELTNSTSGNPIYKITGIKEINILGIIKVEITRTGYVSAETGEVVQVDQSFPSRLFSFISS